MTVKLGKWKTAAKREDVTLKSRCFTSFVVVHSFMLCCITILFSFILPLPTGVKQRLHIYVKMYAGIGMYHGGN